MTKILRMTTVPISLDKLLGGQMRYMVTKGFDVFMVSSPFDKSHLLEEKEISTFIPIYMTRTISPMSDLLSLARLIIVLKKLKPQIVHTHTPKAGLLGMLASKVVGIPIRLHTVAGLPLMEAKGFKRKLLNAVEKLTYKCATMVYPNSTNLKKFILEENFCHENKLKVIGSGSSNGINVDDFKITEEIESIGEIARDKHGILEGDFVFIFVGRLVRDKGIEELVNAFAKFSRIHQNAKLLLVGPKEEELDPLSAECLKEIEMNASIIAVGYQSDVRPYLAMSKALVFPSYREGFPNVPMQAGCFDLPSIVTNINGCNEIIVEGENGLIIPVKDTIALYNAMERLYLDQDLYEMMSANARRMIVNRYEQSKVWSLILEEYNMHLRKNGLL